MVAGGWVGHVQCMVNIRIGAVLLVDGGTCVCIVWQLLGFGGHIIGLGCT